MSESRELFAEVKYIQHKVDSLEKMSLISMRANIELRKWYAGAFQSTANLYEIYKVIDGRTSLNEIVRKTKIPKSTVQIKIKKLEDLGLIEFKSVVDSCNIYQHTIVEKAFYFLRGI